MKEQLLLPEVFKSTKRWWPNGENCGTISLVFLAFQGLMYMGVLCLAHGTYVTLIAIANFLRKSSILLWLGQYQCQFRYVRGDLFPPAPSGAHWLSILCYSGWNSLSWQLLSCGLTDTYQRWKNQASQLEELSDKDFCQSQSSTSGWGVLKGTVCQPDGRFATWTAAILTTPHLLVVLSPRLLSLLSPPTSSPASCTSTPIVTTEPCMALSTTPSPFSMSASWKRERSQKTHSLTRRFSSAGKVIGRRRAVEDRKWQIQGIIWMSENYIILHSFFLLPPSPWITINQFQWSNKYL